MQSVFTLIIEDLSLNLSQSFLCLKQISAVTVADQKTEMVLTNDAIQ